MAVTPLRDDVGGDGDARARIPVHDSVWIAEPEMSSPLTEPCGGGYLEVRTR